MSDLWLSFVGERLDEDRLDHPGQGRDERDQMDEEHVQSVKHFASGEQGGSGVPVEQRSELSL